MSGDSSSRMEAALGAIRSAFANPDVRRIQLAWGGVSFATWAFAIALGVYAFKAGGAAAVGIAGLVRLLPGALASPFAGLLADRFSRRDTLVASAAFSALAIGLGAGAVAVGAPAGVVYALAGVFTVAISPYVPAEGALLPIAARTPQELSSANVTHSVMDNAGFLGGALLTGLLLELSGTEAAFAAAALAGLLSALLLVRIAHDQRPSYLADDAAGGVLRQTGRGFSEVATNKPVRLLGALLTALVFFEGMADVLVVVVALDLLGLGEGSVGGINAAWGIGAIVCSGALGVLLSRGQLALGLLLGSALIGLSTALPAAWVVPVAAYLAYAGMGAGYTFVEVAARTLLQRLAPDEVIARTLGALETARLASQALGSIAAPLLITLFGIRGALVATAALLPVFALIRFARLRSFDAGAAVAELPYQLLRGNSIFSPLPVDTLERVTQDLVRVEVRPGRQIMVEGAPGRRFYLIESGQVEVRHEGFLLRTEGEGESFGEIALLHECTRTASVTATERTALLVLEGEQFVAAVTGNFRSRQLAGEVAETRLANRAGAAPVQ